MFLIIKKLKVLNYTILQIYDILKHRIENPNKKRRS